MQSFEVIWSSIQEYLPQTLAGVGILLVGWVVARLVAAVVKAGLKRTTIDDKLTAWIAGKEVGDIRIENGAAKAVFYTIMVFVLVAFFQTVGLTAVTEPLNGLLNQVFNFAPRLLGAGALAAAAWVVASALRMVIGRGLANTGLDAKVAESAGTEDSRPVPLSKTLGEAAYWLVFLLFLPGILGALALDGLLQPVQGMVNRMLEYLPNLLAAAAILVIGWFVARIVQRIVAGLLTAVGVDGLSENLGIGGMLGKQSLSNLLALIVYVLILIPVIVSSLNALGLDAVTQPASNMLDTMLNSLPGLFAAVLVLAVAFAVGKVASGLITRILDGAGFNELFGRLGLEVAEGDRRPAAIVGMLALVSILLFASVEAFGLLGFDALSALLAELIQFGGHLLMGVIILGAGLWLANVAASSVESSGARQAGLLAFAARVAILILTGAMSLRELGVAEEIITLAFGLSLGAVAVAVAIAFGIGGRDLAARQLDEWHQSMRSQD